MFFISKKFFVYLFKIALILIIFICITDILKTFKNYNEIKETYDTISAITNINKNNLKIDSEKYHKLKDINPDYIFWLYIPNSNINYPVVKSKNNEDYLYKNFKNEKNIGGTIFLDSRNTLDDKNLILHGHNLKDNSMFGTLKYFLDENYIKKNKDIFILFENKIVVYEVFSSFIIDGKNFKYKHNFKNNTEFNNYIKYLTERSSIKFTENKNSDSIITLSTCTNRKKNERIIVSARKKTIINM